MSQQVPGHQGKEQTSRGDYNRTPRVCVTLPPAKPHPHPHPRISAAAGGSGPRSILGGPRARPSPRGSPRTGPQEGDSHLQRGRLWSQTSISPTDGQLPALRTGTRTCTGGLGDSGRWVTQADQHGVWRSPPDREQPVHGERGRRRAQGPARKLGRLHPHQEAGRGAFPVSYVEYKSCRLCCPCKLPPVTGDTVLTGAAGGLQLEAL